MKRFFLLTCIFWFSFLFIPVLSQGEEKPVVGQGEEIQGWTHPSWVAIGLRYNYFRLTNSRRTIVGNMVAEEEDQSYQPLNPLLQINLSKNLSVELSAGQFKATTLNNDYLWYASDGSIDWTSYMMGIQFRLPYFRLPFVPYASWGISYNKTNFNKNNWYYYGFPDPATYTSWTGQGNRPEDFPNNGYRRIHRIDDAYGVYFGLGADYFILKNWALNLDFRYHLLRANWTYELRNNDGLLSSTPGTANLDSWILGLGIKYFF